MSAGLTRDAPIAGIAAELRVRERSVRVAALWVSNRVI